MGWFGNLSHKNIVLILNYNVIMITICKLKNYYLFTLFLIICGNSLFAQKAENTVVANVISENRKNNVVYSFELLTNYNESNSLQHVGRLKTITESDITLDLKGNRLNITINPDKVKEDDLDNLLRGLVVLNGYSGYRFSNK